MKIFRFSLLLAISLLGIAFPTQNASAGGFPKVPPTRFAGMADASVMLYDAASVFGNTAGMAKLTTQSLLLETRYMLNLPQYNKYALGYILPTSSGNFALSFSRYGYSLYNENCAGLSYSRMLGQKVSASVEFNYHYIDQTENFQRQGLALMQLGLLAEPLEDLFIGAHVFNLWNAAYSDNNKNQLPLTMRIGVGYYFSPEVLVSAETELDTYETKRIKTGVSYMPVEKLYVRVGYAANPNSFSVGAGYSFSGFTFDAAVSTHEVLPLQTHLSLMYSF